MEGWGGLSLPVVTATGNLTQLYPNFAPAGAALPVPPGGVLRRPQGGRVGQMSIQSDGMNGGVIEVWDISGLDAVADVSSGTTITNAQLVSLKALGKAKLLWSQNFAGTPTIPAAGSLAFGFLRGLAARFVGTTGAMSLNIIAEGGYTLQVCPLGFAG